MNIKPTKPPGKSEPSGKKKKAARPPEGVFTDIVTSKLSPAEKTGDSDLEGLMVLHKQFTAAINHEINNPLFVVRGMAEMLRETQPPELKWKIIEEADKISGEISRFNRKVIPAVAEECRKAPLSEIQFRRDLVACYLAKVTVPLAGVIRSALDNIDKNLGIDSAPAFKENLQMDRVKHSLEVIRQQAQRIRTIIDRLEKMLPQDIEVKQYVDELKMVNLRNEDH